MTEKLEKRIRTLEEKTPIRNDDELIQALKKIIADEQKKSLSKTEPELISECVEMILKIKKVDMVALAEKERESTQKILAKVKEQEEKSTKKSVHIHKKIHRRVLIALVAVISSFVIMSAAAVAMGYGSIVDWGKSLLNFPEKTTISKNGIDYSHSSDSRNYDNIEEMTRAENLNIIYPRELPIGYTFETIKITNMGEYSSIAIKSNENYVILAIRTNDNSIIPEYSDEVNGIKCNIINRDETYMAYWILNNNYYTLECSSKEDLLEILHNTR